ncbi:MAG TPA: adenylate/guanylate cyclase domain-containing protein, partial [Xanthobacteraceae bacterium]|nr:adenylate/guanylate cyclase domain-containing protein [Xanthobacteraceae bacterium]
MAAHVAGYSRLMGEDEAGTAKAVHEHREAATPLVREFGGRLVKTTGDGVLLEFPSVVAAVECAIAIQKQMVERNAGVPEERRVLYRMGVNVGDVLIEDDDILGDGVNVAARLESIAEPGGICISGSAYDQVRGRIEADFTDLGEQSLKNIARPVRVYAVRTGAAASPSALHASATEKSSLPRHSIVVLPFADLGGDPEQDYFVDGVTESLTTDLSRISGSFVIGRNTAYSYKAKHVDLKQIGRELNVRYVLEGSVQRSGNRMRVNVQLIDAQTGAHVWAERFDKPVAELFDMHDEVVTRLATTLNSQLIAAEARRAERSPHPDSLDLYFQGVHWFQKGLIPAYLSKARELLEEALKRDPGNINALVWLALVENASGGLHSGDRAARLSTAEANATKALSMAPDHALAHLCMGLVLNSTNRALRGLAELERALQLNPSEASVHGHIGYAKICLGRAEETEAHVREIFRFSPRNSFTYLWMSYIGIADLLLGRDEEAVVWLQRSIDTNANYSLSRFYLAAALAHWGK